MLVLARLRVVVVAALLGSSLGCDPPAAPVSLLVTPSDTAARILVQELLAAAQRRDADQVARRLCNRSGAHPAALAALSGPLHIDRYTIAEVWPAWVGAEPYFRVDVELGKGAASHRRSLSVRVRDGCVDGLLGEPVQSVPAAERGELAL